MYLPSTLKIDNTYMTISLQQNEYLERKNVYYNNLKRHVVVLLVFLNPNLPGPQYDYSSLTSFTESYERRFISMCHSSSVLFVFANIVLVYTCQQI